MDMPSCVRGACVVVDIWGDERLDRPDVLDLGENHWAIPSGWNPQRDINPQYDGIADIPLVGYSILHIRSDGAKCSGFVTLDTPEIKAVFTGHQVWQIHSLDPLHIEPSILCKMPIGKDDAGETIYCHDHGFIRGGRWVVA